MAIPQFPENFHPKSRQVRVFISSTFKDMQAERDELVKFSFPELRRRCSDRQVEFVDVDLRWGITDEQKSEGRVLPICLAEIDRCRPYFIGLLGERYGWVPRSIDEQLAEIHPWINKQLQKSVTELEFLYGGLGNLVMKGHSFFYFRNPEASKKVESELSSQKGYLPEPETSQSKLSRLKEKIRESGHPLLENYPNPKTLGQMVIEDLWALIEAKFPKEELPSPLERERQDHQAFAAARTRVYIPRKDYFSQLDDHVAGDGPPLVLFGESGCGKSALLANWAKGYRRDHPEDFMVQHFIGSSAESADYIGLLRRVMGEIKERAEPKGRGDPDATQIRRAPRTEESQEIPADPEKVMELFPFWLARAAARGRFILIIDGLNQLEDRDNALQLNWLPEYFPPNIRVILSTLDGPSQEILEKRGWQTLRILLFDQSERRHMVDKYLALFTKTLSPDIVDQIVSADQSANPLYLRALLEELRVYGEHQTLRKQIEHYLAATGVEDLYEKILERYEADYDRDRPGLVKEAMSLIWASRRGLAETELLDLLGAEEKPLPAAYWSPLYLATEESLVNRSGLLNFFHDFLRKAVKNRYLSRDEQKRNCHLILADYFEGRGLDNRRVDELPWQLAKAAQWERLKECLTDSAIFERLSTDAKKYELLSYWLNLKGKFDIAQAYSDSLEQYEKSKPPLEDLSRLIHQIALFLNLIAKFHAAEPLIRRALEIDEKNLGKDHPNVAILLNNLASLLKSTNHLIEIKPLIRRALEIDEKNFGRDHPNVARDLNNLVALTKIRFRPKEAEPLMRRALEIDEKNFGKDDPSIARDLINLAQLLHNTHRLKEAESLIRRAIAINEKALGLEHPLTALCLSNLAQLLQDTCRFKEAESLMCRVLEIDEKSLGENHPNVASDLNNLALLLGDIFRLEEAESLIRQALSISEKALGWKHPLTSAILGNANEIHEKTKTTRPLCRRVLSIWMKARRLCYCQILSIWEKVRQHCYCRKARQPAAVSITDGDQTREGVKGIKLSDNSERLAVTSTLERQDLSQDEQDLAVFFEEMIEKLERELPVAALLITLCAFLAPDDIPLNDLCNGLKNLPPPLQTAAEDPESFNQLVTTIVRTSLAKRTGESLSVHNIVQTIIRNRLTGAERAEWAERAANLSIGTERAARLFNDVGMYRSLRADFDGARAAYQKALALYKKALGPNHETVAACLSNLALTYDEEGKYADAEALHMRASIIWKRSAKKKTEEKTDVFWIFLIIFFTVFGAIIGLLVGGLIGAGLGLLISGVHGALPGAVVGAAFIAVYSAATYYVTEFKNEDAGTAILFGAPFGAVLWAIFCAIIGTWTHAIDGFFFGLYIGMTVIGVTMLTNRAVLSTTLGGVIGAVLALFLGFLLTATEDATGFTVFEAFIDGNVTAFLDMLPRDMKALLSYTQKMFYWPLAGAIFGAFIGFVGPSPPDALDYMYKFYMKSPWTRAKDPEVLYYLGLALANRGRYWLEKGYLDDAIDALEKALQMGENHAGMRYYRGLALVDRADLAEPERRIQLYEDGLAEFNIAISLQPDYIPVYVARGDCLSRLERHPEAIASVSFALEHNPNYAFARTVRGISLWVTDQVDDALADFDISVQLDPSVVTLCNRASLYNDLYRYEEALVDINRALEINSNHSVAYHARGEVYKRTGRHKDAIADFTRSLNFEPDSPLTLGGRAMAYHTLGQLDQAMADLDRAVVLDFLDKDWWLYKRALIKLIKNNKVDALRDLAEAKAFARKTLQKTPQNSRVMFNLSIYNLAAGDHYEAKQLLKKGIQMGAKAHRLKLSIDELSEFLTLFPDHKTAKELLDILRSHLESQG